MAALLRGWWVIVTAIVVPWLTLFAAGNRIPVFLVLEPPAEIAAIGHQAGRSLTLAEAHRLAIMTAREHAEISQAPILTRLDRLVQSSAVTSLQTYWAANSISLECDPALVAEFRTWPELLAVETDPGIALVPITPPMIESRRHPLDDGISVALCDIRAQEAWALGLTGVGVLLANFDSGVNGSHPGLSSHWRGNSGHPFGECWLDLVEPITATPGDNDGHGTLTMGLQCGMIPGDTVGVAWNAQFIAAAVAEGGFTINNALQAFQWILDPDGNPSTFDDVPRVLSNSWGFNGGVEICNNVLFQAIDLAEAAGIAVLWSAGNEGPPASTIRNPANRADNSVSGFAVGGWDGVTDSVWISSSRGPTPCSTDSILRVKPELVAPSRDVRSTYLGSAFASSSGTSFSAPLAAGTVALMLEANPMLPPDSLLELLMLTAVDEDAPGLDNSAGYGRLDALMACQAALTGLGWIRGHVEDPWGNPLQASVTLVNQPHHTVTNGQGDFLFPHPAFLPLQLQIIADGHLPQLTPLTVMPQDTSYLTIILQPTVQGVLTGNVIDCRGQPASGAYISLIDDAVPPVFSDENGRFVMTLNPGTYSVACSSGTCGSVVVPGIQILAGAITDIECVLPLNPAFLCSTDDPFGYYLCDSNDPGGPTEVFRSISPTVGGSGVIHNLPDDGNAPLVLPFPVTFYGQTYNRIYLNSNGIVSFGRYATAFNNLPLPYNFTPALFPFWEDFSDNLGGHILSDHDPAHGTFTMEWYEIPYFVSIPPPTDSANFQVVIYDRAAVPTVSGNNVIEFRYGRIPRVNSSTVGIDRASGNGFVRYGYNGQWETHAVPVEQDLTIRVSDQQVSSGVPSIVLSPPSLTISLDPSTYIDTTIYVMNAGNVPLAFVASTTPLPAYIQGPDTIDRTALLPDYPKGYSPSRPDREDAVLDDWIPNADGYAWRQSHTDTSVHYSFFDIAGIGTNLGLNLDDTTSLPRSLPFEFPMYGRVFTKYGACTNGFMSFWSQGTNFVNEQMSASRDPYFMLAPYWTDLNPAVNGQIWEYFDLTNDRFIVQWNEIPPWGAPAANNLTFQVILYRDGGVDFVYERMRSFVNLKTAGMKGGRSNQYLQFTYNGSLVDSFMTIRVARPDTAASSLRILSGFQAVVPPLGQQAVTLRVKNSRVSQGLVSLPLFVKSSAPDGNGIQLNIAMQGGVPFEPHTVIAAQSGIISLHWQPHPTGSFAIWTSLPNDSTFVPLVATVADTQYTLGLPADEARIYAVTLSGQPAPIIGSDHKNVLSVSK